MCNISGRTTNLLFWLIRSTWHYWENKNKEEKHCLARLLLCCEVPSLSCLNWNLGKWVMLLPNYHKYKEDLTLKVFHIVSAPSSSDSNLRLQKRSKALRPKGYLARRVYLYLCRVLYRAPSRTQFSRGTVHWFESVTAVVSWFQANVESTPHGWSVYQHKTISVSLKMTF